MVQALLFLSTGVKIIKCVRKFVPDAGTNYVFT